MLGDKTNGHFLVRESQNYKGDYTLCVRYVSYGVWTITMYIHLGTNSHCLQFTIIERGREGGRPEYNFSDSICSAIYVGLIVEAEISLTNSSPPPPLEFFRYDRKVEHYRVRRDERAWVTVDDEEYFENLFKLVAVKYLYLSCISRAVSIASV
jgi:hypothetical protein